MAGVTRFGVSLDENLLAQFDRLIGTRGVKHGTFSATAEGRALS